ASKAVAPPTTARRKNSRRETDAVFILFLPPRATLVVVRGPFPPRQPGPDCGRFRRAAQTPKWRAQLFVMPRMPPLAWAKSPRNDCVKPLMLLRQANPFERRYE